MQSENINELVTALSKAQGEIKSAIKDSLNPHFKSKYADLNSVWDACRSQLSKNGLAVIQTTEMKNDRLTLVTTLAHSSGQWMKSDLPVLSATNTPQALGSALTYMRRYSLSAITGVAPGDDDDGEAAMGNAPKKPKPLINEEQVNRLAEALSHCQENYVKVAWEHLNKNGIYKIEELPVDLFNRILAGALKNAETEVTNDQ